MKKPLFFVLFTVVLILGVYLFENWDSIIGNVVGDQKGKAYLSSSCNEGYNLECYTFER